MLADRDCPALCAFRAVTTYISAAQLIGWDSTAGHLFFVVTTEGSQQGYLRVAELPSHYAMHSSRARGSRGKSLAGTAVDEMMKIARLEDKVSREVLHRGYL